MDETAVHCRVELFSDLDSVNNYLCFSDIFVVASEILSKQKISAVCPVSTRKPRTERFIFGDTINCDYMGKPSCHVCFLGHCGELVSFHYKVGGYLAGFEYRGRHLKGLFWWEI